MKVKVTEYNLKYIYMFAKSFLAYKNKNEEFDFDIMKRMLDKIKIITHPHKKGLYDIGEKKERYDKGELNDDLIKYIETFSDFDKNFPQGCSGVQTVAYRICALRTDVFKPPTPAP